MIQIIIGTFLTNLPQYSGMKVGHKLFVVKISECQCQHQGGITCGAIDEPRKSSKAIDERVIINFRDKNVVIARFCDKNVVIARFRDKTAYVWGLRYR